MPTGPNIYNIASVKLKQEAVKSLGTLEQLNLKLSLGRTAHPKKTPVFVYKFHSEKRPSSMQTVEAPYYLGINHSKDSSKCWFKASPMGVNKLTSLMKTMAGKAGFEQRLTNHSARE